MGGQGVLLASAVLGSAALEEGKEVVMSELHGMAQRGGSVVATVRIGEGVLSPLIPSGGANLLLGFEPAESLRAIQCASKSTSIVVNVHPIVPIQVSLGLEAYPPVERILEEFARLSDLLYPIDALSVARESGSEMAVNSVLLGAVCAVKAFPLSKDTVQEELIRRVPRQSRNINETAFSLGHEKIRSLLSEQVQSPSTD